MNLSIPYPYITDISARCILWMGQRNPAPVEGCDLSHYLSTIRLVVQDLFHHRSMDSITYVKDIKC